MKLIRVDYKDICAREGIENASVLVTEFGLLVEDNGEDLIIIKDYHHDPEIKHECCSIPKGCIKKITRIKEFKNLV